MAGEAGGLGDRRSMRRARRAYYDVFSRFYDRFVAIHSGDREGLSRRFLAEQAPLEAGGSVLDLCTGTAALIPYLQSKVGPEGRVVGLDFSHGMLRAGRAKTRSLPNVCLVEADAGRLPFVPGAFDVVTCSHAFYELKGETQHDALREVSRVLGPRGVFLLMEHDVPRNPLVKVLFYIRLASVGAGQVFSFLRREQEVLRRYFANVEKILAPAGRSKVLICRKGESSPLP